MPDRPTPAPSERPPSPLARRVAREPLPRPARPPSHREDAAALRARAARVVRDAARLRAIEASGLLAPDGDGESCVEAAAVDRVARLAARALRTPVAQVNVITDDAQVPVASVAHVEPERWAAPVGLESSYCQYVVAGGRPLAVTDAPNDPLVRESRATIDGGVVSYLGAPLRAPAEHGGHVLGSVCVADFARRDWTGEDVAVLEELAALAAAQISWRDVVHQDLGRVRRELATTEGQVAELARELAALLEAEREARAGAEAASRAKTEFLAAMSHELRTPLVAISGYTQLLVEGMYGPLVPPQHEALARIQESQRHLLALIDDVLSYAHVERGTVQYELADVPLGPVLADAGRAMEPAARARRVALGVEGGDALPAVRADPTRLREVLLKLLANAVKFTEAGGSVDVRVEEAGDWVLVRVRDTGVGIPAEQREAIFAPFVQGESGYTRSRGGTGLGLTIGRDLARGMGGDLRVESTAGAGSTFTLMLPRA